MNVDPKTVTSWIVIVVVPVVAAALIAALMQLTNPEFIIIQIENHFAATVGLPMAALLSAFIVVALKHSSGPMKFEGLGFKFEGASCEVVLWVMCFLVISLCIRMLWNAGLGMRTPLICKLTINI